MGLNRRPVLPRAGVLVLRLRPRGPAGAGRGLLSPAGRGLQERPPQFLRRDDLVHLETLIGSWDCADWVKLGLSDLLLGPVPADFFFRPTDAAISYGTTGARAHSPPADSLSA